MLRPAGCLRYQGENRADSLSTWQYIYQPVSEHPAITADGHLAEQHSGHHMSARKCLNGNMHRLAVRMLLQVAWSEDVHVCCSIMCCSATPLQKLKYFHHGLFLFKVRAVKVNTFSLSLIFHHLASNQRLLKSKRCKFIWTDLNFGHIITLQWPVALVTKS